MKQIPNLPSSIAQYISGKPYTVDDIGRSGSAIYLFDDCVLKVEPHNKANEQAVSMMRWLNSKLPTPAVPFVPPEAPRMPLPARALLPAALLPRMPHRT